jgi:O-antigen/teichoic acid export membrane protein
MLARKIAFNVFFNSAAKIISTILALVSIGFITRYLGKEGFGNYATVLAFFAFFNAIADLGLYSVGTREISRPDAHEKSIMGKLFTLRLFSSLIVFALSPLLVFWLPYEASVKWGIIAVAGTFVLTSGYSVLNGIFQKNIAMNKVAGAEVLGKIIQVSLVILAVQKDWGFTAIILAFFFSSLVNAILVFLLSRKYVKFSLDFDFAFWKKFLRESAPMGISVIITFFYFKMDTILLSVLKSNAEVGIYNVAYKIIENVTFFPAMIMGLIFPLLARYIFSERHKFDLIADKTFKIFLLLIIPVVLGVLFLSEKIVSLIGGAGFPESASVLRILIFGLVFIFFGNFFNSLLLAGNLQKKLMQALFWCAIFNIGLNLIFIPLFSYRGAAIISALTEMLVVTFTVYLSFRHLHYLPKLNNAWGIAASAGVMGLFLFLFQNINFYFLVVASALVYFLMLWVTHAISNEELKLIFSKQNTNSKEDFSNEPASLLP